MFRRRNLKPKTSTTSTTKKIAEVVSPGDAKSVVSAVETFSFKSLDQEFNFQTLPTEFSFDDVS